MSSKELTGTQPLDNKKPRSERNHQPPSRLRAMIRGVYIGVVASLAAGRTENPLPVELGVASWLTIRSILGEYIRLNEGNEIPVWAGLVAESGLIAFLIANMPEEILLAARQAGNLVLEIFQEIGLLNKETVEIMRKIVEMKDYYFMMLLYFLTTSNYWLALMRNKIQSKSVSQEITE